MVDGGGHERGMRSGTVPVPLVVGFGRAAEIAREEMAAEGKRLAALRDRLQEQILAKVDEAYVNGHPERRLPHNLNISFAYVEGESVLMGLNREAALASGSACTGSPPRRRSSSWRPRRSRSCSGCGRCPRSTSSRRKAWT